MTEFIKGAAHQKFGALIARLRIEAGFAKQQDLASSLAVKQQTVSRWEQGLSRPRENDLRSLAQALKTDEGQLFVAAGYAVVRSTTTETATPFDRPLPLHALPPEGFERFCRFLLERLYRGQGEVQPYGGPGHKQHGIDILVRGDFGLHTYQCKRVEKFGAHKVHATVADQTYEADLKVILLSTTASPEARDAIGRHKDWQLWDREDISLRLRSLPKIDQIDLVDIFFRGQRYDLLGEEEAGPLLSVESFFKPFLAEDRLFNHRWALVGRRADEQRLQDHLSDKSVVLILLVGGPGYGKTRLLRETADHLAKSQPQTSIRFVSPTEEIREKHLGQLGTGPQVLVVDDAHDRDDLGVLLRYAASNEGIQLIFSLRPYGREALKHQAATFSLSEPQVQVVLLDPLGKAEAKELAEEVLLKEGGPLAAADGIAEATYGSPLATVLGAQVVAREKIAPPLIGNVKDFQDHILARLQDVITGSIATGQDTIRLQAILRVVCLVQPVVPDDPNLLELIKVTEEIEPDHAARLLRLLIEAGVLFKRGRRYRIAPDLLADSVIQLHYVSPKGIANEAALAVFDLARSEHLKHLLVNLGRLEWRLNEGETENGVVLESIAPKMQWRDDFINAHVIAAEAAAYFQPRFAINFAKRLIKEGHGDTAAVCGMLRNAAYTTKYLEDACLLLWQAGSGDNRALHQHPRHGIRVLKEMAAFEPNKPIEVVQKVVRLAIDLLNRPSSLLRPYTPFTILEGALNTEMQSTSSTSRSLTITRYSLPFEQARALREEIVASLLTRIAGQDTRMGFLAAGTLSEALRGPMHGGERDSWDREHFDILDRLYSVLTQESVHPVVLTRAAVAVSWHAIYGPVTTRPMAQKILGLLYRDLPTRLVRALVDGWGSETYRISESGEREVHESDKAALIKDIRATILSADDLYDFIAHWLSEIERIASEGYGAPFMLINRLIAEVPSFALEVLQRYREEESSPLASYAGAALSQLVGKSEGHALIADLLKRSEFSESLKLVAEAYARHTPKEPYGEHDLVLLRQIFRSNDSSVLALTGSIALTVAKMNPGLAVELICYVDFKLAGNAIHELFMWLSHKDTIPAAAISEEQLKFLTRNLAKLKKLDDYWVLQFLKRALQVVPDAVVNLITVRLWLARKNTDWTYRAIEREYPNGDVDAEISGLGLMGQPGYERRLRLLLDRARKTVNRGNGDGDIGEVIVALCGKFKSPLLATLLEWMKQGTKSRVEVVTAVLHCAQNSLLYEQPQFIRELFDCAEVIGEEAVDDVRSALIGATLSGGRSTTPGDPFPEDVRLRDYANLMLNELSRTDPAYEMFSVLLQAAEQGIERQRREKEAMNAQDEE